MCHNCLAEVLKEQGSLEEAEAQARQGLAIREKVGPAAGPGQYNAGVCMLRLVRPGSGSLLQRISRHTHAHATSTMVNGTGWTLRACMLVAPACVDSTLSVHINLKPVCRGYLQVFGSEHAAVAMSLATLASVLRGRQQLEEAVTTINRCVELRRGNAALAKGVQMASGLFHQVRCGVQASLRSVHGCMFVCADYVAAQTSVALLGCPCVCLSVYKDCPHALW